MLRLADFFMRLEARLSYALIGLVQATRFKGGLDLGSSYFAALAALIASISMGVTLNRSPQMP